MGIESYMKLIDLKIKIFEENIEIFKLINKNDKVKIKTFYAEMLKLI